MSTNPFAGAGLGQFGNELKSSGGMGEALAGIPGLLLAKAIAGSDLKGWLNKLGESPVAPPDLNAPDIGNSPVAPSTLSNMFGTGSPTASSSFHPELSSTLSTSLFQ